MLAAVGLSLLGGGALYGYREYWANQPDKVWVPLPLRADLSMADQKDAAEKIDAGLREDEVLRGVVGDLGLVGKLGVVDEDAAVKELGGRLFVEVGSADTPGGTVPSIHIGVRGISRENPLLMEMATRIMKDVWLMLGVDPETGRPLGEAGAPGGF